MLSTDWNISLADHEFAIGGPWSQVQANQSKAAIIGGFSQRTRQLNSIVAP
jgi:hypothetical protein